VATAVLPALFATLAIKAATRLLDTNHGFGSKHPSVTCLSLFGATTHSYKNTTGRTAKIRLRHPEHSQASPLPPPSPQSPHSVISLPVLSDQWPALVISPISTKKNSSKLSKPNCLLNNILNLGRNNMIATPTCGDFCFRAVRGSSSSSSGEGTRPTRLAVEMIMRSVYPDRELVRSQTCQYSLTRVLTLWTHHIFR